VSNVTNMNGVFSGATSFNRPIGTWDVSNVTNMVGMFKGATSFNQDIGYWDVSKVTELDHMFWGATSFNQDIGAWDVSNAIGLSYMFRGDSSFNQNIGKWNVSKVSYMDGMFQDATSFNQNLGSWDVSKGYYMREMLHNCKLSIANYDSTLIGWNRQGISNKNLGLVAPLKYCKGSQARSALIARGWQILGDKLDCSVGVLDPTENKVAIYPNPTQGSINITGIDISDFQITDVLGRMVKTGRINGSALDISGLPKGVYLLQVRKDNQWVAVKIVKE